jgi:2-oxoglutarate dehydrogenase E2 component (dihydrolipoamide succinyltransferase)
MSVEIRVPSLGESVTEATVARWFKQVGDEVSADEPIVELETDKVTLEFNAPASGTLTEIVVEEGGEVEVGALLGSISEGAAQSAAGARPAEKPAEKPAIKLAATAAEETAGADVGPGNGALSPSVRKLLEEHGLDATMITPSGPKGNLTKGDVLAAVEARQSTRAVPAENGSAEAAAEAPEEALAPEPPEPASEPPAPRAASEPSAPPAAEVPARGAAPDARPAAVPIPSRPAAQPAPAARPAPAPPAAAGAAPVRARGEREERVKMTRLRRRIAQRLKEAQNTAAMLTTYNEADMSAVMALRQRYRESFEQKHGIRLGFMSFFVKASINALQAYPAVNAEIDGEEIVYKHHYDIGVAVGTPSGLVVPVVRDADRLGFADLEKTIGELGQRARDGQLAIEDLMGGTFTISNGGVYGSLMSSPILNPPQVGILGMHKIQERPVVVAGEIAIRPMMYLALSYDHRIVDGREAVSFLVRIKECIEDPERLLLDV